MLEQILRHLNNWFVVDVQPGDYTVEKGSITLPFLASGQYFRIIGSVFNDGLHQYPATDLMDESFTGYIWALAIPKAIFSLTDEISAWLEKYGEAVASPYTSESFGGYSYSKSAENTGNGAAGGWQAAFRARLNPWRKIKGVEP